MLGGGGQVARAVASVASAAHTVRAKSRGELDITDEAALVAEVKEYRPDWIVNCAAYTAVDQAEIDLPAAHETNVTAVGALARVCAGFGCRLLHVSTDFVFDGSSNLAYRPTDRPNPLNAYGSTKLGGERLVLSAGADAIVLRTAWVYASTGRNFALTMLRLMREQDEVRVVCDQIGTPTWAASVAQGIEGILRAAPGGGIYHWTDSGLATWYDFAVAIQDEALARGMLSRAVPIIPIATSEYPTPARRPSFSVLDSESTRAAIGIRPRHWRHSLGMMFDELRAL